ncbi:MAG: hypothetical protein IK130_00745, partial [Oscillospiraceae bacterium]|nr:hypothetical protein [Oscillospiraceae bacterium]
PVYRVNGCQMAVRMPAGTHRITLTHHISGMVPALCIAGFGIFAAILWQILRKRLTDRQYERLGQYALTAFQIGYCGVIILVYLVPVALSIAGAILGFY